jgi:exosortase
VSLIANIKQVSMTRIGKQSSVFLVLIVASLLAGWHPLFDTIGLAWRNDQYTQILLVLPVSIFMMIAERHSIGAGIRWSIGGGSGLILSAGSIACSTWIWSASLGADVLLTVRMLALVLAWIGCFFLCFGSQTARKLIFPLLFLFALVPLPRMALDSLIALLQIGSAWSAHAFFAAFGVPVFQQGMVLTVPGLIIQVAQECSSIRSSSMLIVATLVMAQALLFSFWRKVLVVGIAVPFSVLKNGLRIFVIASLGTRVDPGYLNGRLHHQGGILFFGVALSGILVLLLLLRKGELRALPTRPIA